MSGFRGYIRKHIPSIVHSVLRRNRVTDLFIENVYEQARNYFFIEKGLRPQYRNLSKREIYKRMSMLIYQRIAIIPSITKAFTWSTTIQGYDFWNDIENEIIQERENLR